MISYKDLSKLLLGLGGKKAAEVPDELRVIVQAYWESEILAQSTNGSGLQSDLSRPSEFQELIQYFQEYSIQDLNIERDYPNIAVAITLIAIWLGQIRDPLLLQCTEAPITQNHLRTWTECLLLVIRYLESTLNPGDSKRKDRTMTNPKGMRTAHSNWLIPGNYTSAVMSSTSSCNCGKARPLKRLC